MLARLTAGPHVLTMEYSKVLCNQVEGGTGNAGYDNEARLTGVMHYKYDQPEAGKKRVSATRH